VTVSLLALALAIAALVIVVVGLLQDGRRPLAYAVLLLALAQIVVRI
jgi:hypothetical protein